MVISSRRQRSGRLVFWVAGALFVIFGILGGYHFLHRARFTPDPNLLPELEASVILEDDTPVAVGEWPQWRGPRRDGVSLETGILSEWPENGPREVWKKPLGQGYSSIVVAGRRAYAMFREGSEEVVICWNRDEGTEHWRFKYPCTFNNGWGAGPRSTPTVSGDRIFTVGAAGMLHCLETADGNLVWKHDLLTEFKAKNLQWGVAFSPLVDGDLVFTMPGGPDGYSLAAFDKHTGDLKWRTLADPAGYSSPIAVTAGGVRQIVYFTGHSLVAVTLENGKLLWRFPWPTSNGVNAATPIFFRAKNGDQIGDYLFISSGYGKGCALVKVVPNGEGACSVKLVYEGNQMMNHFASSVLWKGHIYGCSDPGILKCVDVKTGTVRWESRGYEKGSVVIVDGKLIVLGEHGKVGLVDADPEEYRERSNFRFTKGKTWAAPSPAWGKLYLRDEEQVICLDLKKP